VIGTASTLLSAANGLTTDRRDHVVKRPLIQDLKDEYGSSGPGYYGRNYYGSGFYGSGYNGDPATTALATTDLVTMELGTTDTPDLHQARAIVPLVAAIVDHVTGVITGAFITDQPLKAELGDDLAHAATATPALDKQPALAPVADDTAMSAVEWAPAAPAAALAPRTAERR
jgi:hypothetical protein